MRVHELDADEIASVLFKGQCYKHHGGQRWFVAQHANIEIEPQPNGDYVGEKLHIHMRPRQDPITACGKFASSSVATFRS